MPEWKATSLLERWLAHHGLGTPQEVSRVSFLVVKYEAHLVWDLQSMAGVDLGELWRRRQYRRLLQLIDHLPSHSHYTAAMMDDPEHAKMIAEAQAKASAAGKGGSGDSSPSLTTWTPEVAVMTRVLDAVKGVQHSIVLANADPKKATPQPPEPEPRPKTLLMRESKRAENQMRQAAHEKLAARMLRKRRKSDSSEG